MVSTVVTPRLTLAGAASKRLCQHERTSSVEPFTCASIEPEGDPRHDHNEAAGYVDLDHVVAHRPGELNIRQEAAVVPGAQRDLNLSLTVSDHHKLRERHVRGHLH